VCLEDGNYGKDGNYVAPTVPRKKQIAKRT